MLCSQMKLLPSLDTPFAGDRHSGLSLLELMLALGLIGIVTGISSSFLPQVITSRNRLENISGRDGIGLQIKRMPPQAISKQAPIALMTPGILRLEIVSMATQQPSAIRPTKPRPSPFASVIYEITSRFLWQELRMIRCCINATASPAPIINVRL